LSDARGKVAKAGDVPLSCVKHLNDGSASVFMRNMRAARAIYVRPIWAADNAVASESGSILKSSTVFFSTKGEC
jgi:hypothetical protein